MHRVASLAKRWLLGTHQGSVDEAHLPAYLNEFVFRFNRRRSRSRGLVFYRVLELAAGHDPVRFQDLLAGKKPRPAPATSGLGHPPSLDRPAANRPWRTGELQLQLPIPLRLNLPDGGYRSPGPRIAQTTVRDEPMVALYAGSPNPSRPSSSGVGSETRPGHPDLLEPERYGMGHRLWLCGCRRPADSMLRLRLANWRVCPAQWTGGWIQKLIKRSSQRGRMD